ncbi:MAG: AbrB/MazE/SpoVT family DNA-binding domain-containing protein [Chloroflexota bacterium]|nr:AbrB/MazE/SpoVT family DNA-binding domain-containing protein [Chloroflexota bacterium]
MTTVNTKIVKIGNSQGIRIPKLLLEQTQLGKNVELLVEDGALVIRPARKPRQNWSESFAQMAARGDDNLLNADVIEHEWDDQGWKW